MIANERRQIRIPVPACWADHRFLGRSVLPAVDAMGLLAAQAIEFRPDILVAQIREAGFDKFLEVFPEKRELSAYCDLSELPGGSVQASLVTRMKTGSAGFMRTKTHVRVLFPQQPAIEKPPHPAKDPAARLEGVCVSVSPDRIYAELVPFGPYYHNICKPLMITHEGALAVIQAPAAGIAFPPLGSPLVLDAAFHAACVWGQRFAGVVAFPVGIDRRFVLMPVTAGERCFCRVIPVRICRDLLQFDLWIFNSSGQIREAALGVRMRDVSGGRLRPPRWITAGG